MTGRKRMEAAFSAAGTVEVPVVVPYEGIFLRDHWEEVTRLPWWAMFSEDVEVMLAVTRDYLARVRPDWVYAGACLPRRIREALRVEERPGEIYEVDELTGAERLLERRRVGGWSADGMCASAKPEDATASVAEIDARVGEPDALDAKAVRCEGRADFADAVRREFDVWRYASVASPLWRCYGLWGFEGMMLMVAEHPELVRHACGRYLEHAKQRVRLAAAVGVDGIFIEECMTDIISPGAFADLCLPGVREVTKVCRECGVRSIYYFCGNPAGKWEYLLTAGADALSLEESKKGFEIDIEDVVDRVGGRMTVLGNLDAMHLLEKGSDAELRAEIARQLAAGRRNGGRFVMSLGSPVTPGTSVERVRRYCEWTRELGG